jgi:hypothetical protein
VRRNPLCQNRAIERFTRAWNAGASPFKWVKTPDEILAEAVRNPQATSGAGHYGGSRLRKASCSRCASFWRCLQPRLPCTLGFRPRAYARAFTARSKELRLEMSHG